MSDSINYTLGRDYLTFTSIDPHIIYYINEWNGLTLTDCDVTVGTPYGNVYSPGDILTYDPFSATFIIDENWEVYETLSKMVISNAPTDGSSYNPTFTDITLFLYNNTVKKTVAHIDMYNAYLQAITNVSNNYNIGDNTVPPRTVTCLFRYQYMKFFRENEEI